MAQQRGIAVRRARADDAGQIAIFVNRIRQGRARVDDLMVIERFGSVGFLLAERDGNLVGTLGWQAENLVVRVTDFLIWPASERVAAGQALLSEMEQEAAGLQCEVALLILPRPTPLELVGFCKALGYEPRVVASLPRAWQEAAREARIGDDETVLMKQLRTDRVVRPI